MQVTGSFYYKLLIFIIFKLTPLPRGGKQKLLSATCYQNQMLLVSLVKTRERLDQFEKKM